MMTRAFLAAILTLLATSVQPVPKGTPDTDLGLTKTSVFAVPSPDAFAYPNTRPGKSELLPRAFHGAPPQVPHRVARYLPITAEDNRCADCHDDPDHFDGSVAQGKPIPMPRSHYRMVAGEDGEIPELAGSRFVCVICHVPQADAPDLVGNSFDGPKAQRK